MLQLISRLFTHTRPALTPTAPPQPVPMFGETAEAWLAFTASHRKAAQARSQVRRDLISRWGHRSLVSITKQEVVVVIEDCAKFTGTESARALWSYTSRIMKWAVQRGILDANPCTDLSIAAMISAATSRERTLSRAELAAIWCACAAVVPERAPCFDGGVKGYGDVFNRIARLLILTGLRRCEIGGLRWSELDRDKMVINIPRERMKGARPHVIPINQSMLDLIGTQRSKTTHVFGRDGRSEFSGWSRAKRRLDEQCGVIGWTLHDLRRTCSTMWHELDLAQPWVIEAQLHHSQQGVAGIYNRADYLPQRRELIDRWTAELHRMVESKP